MALSEEDRREITSLIAQAAPAPTQATPTPAPAPAQATPEPLTQAGIVAAFTEVLKNNTKTADVAVHETLFQERLQETYTKIPGFEKYLGEETDLFGKTFLASIDAEPDYNKKVAALSSLAKKVMDASITGNGGADMPFITKQQKAAGDAVNAEYAKADKELVNGDRGAFDTAFFETFASEVAELTSP